MIDTKQANVLLAKSEPAEIIEWAIKQATKPVVTTNFGPHEAVILHMAVQVSPDIPVIWIDSGYNTRDTYKVAQNLIDTLKLNIHVYAPNITAARRDAALGGIPSVDDEAHAEFTEQFKLEPFTRAMNEQQPDLWLTAVRSEQTAFRSGLEMVSDASGSLTKNELIKVAPLLNWKEAEMQAYLDKHGLPNVSKYFDPTKAEANRECGLHTKL